MEKIKKIKTLKPLNNSVITTANTFNEDQFDNGVVVATKGSLSPFLTVVAVGSFVRDINVGDIIEVNPAAYTHKKYGDNSLRDDIGANNPKEVSIPTVEIDGVNHFALTSNDIKWVVTLEEQPDEPKSNIILSEKPKIIL